MYTSKVWLGNPAKQFIVVVDTGSNDLWVNYLSSNGCPTSSLPGFSEPTFFDLAGSSTASLLPCEDQSCSYCSESQQCSYNTTYIDGLGTSGFYVKDVLSFNAIQEGTNAIVNSSVAQYSFGCSTQCTGDYSPFEMDGILGLGPGPNSFVSQISSMGIAPPIFSHCLKGEGSGGTLIFREILEPPLAYTPLVPSRTNYIVNLPSISVGGKKLKIARKYQRAIIDTGTTYGTLVKEIFDPLAIAVNGAVSQFSTPSSLNGKACYYLVNRTIDIFPNISLNFEGVATIVFMPEEYLRISSFDGDAEIWCLPFHSSPTTTLLGAFFLREIILEYDLLRKRIGLAKYNCSLPLHVGEPHPLPTTSTSTPRDTKIILRVLCLCILAFFLNFLSL